MALSFIWFKEAQDRDQASIQSQDSSVACCQQSYAQILGESLNLPRDLFSNEEINPGADPCRSAGVAVPRALSVLCSGEGAEGGPSGEREEALLGHRLWHQRTFCAFTLKILQREGLEPNMIVKRQVLSCTSRVKITVTGMVTLQVNQRDRKPD